MTRPTFTESELVPHFSRSEYTFELKYLDEVRDKIPEMVELLLLKWGDALASAGWGRVHLTESISNSCSRLAIPLTKVVISGDDLVGFASLTGHGSDLPRPDLYPWLARVYVKAEYRGMGVGAALVGAIEAEASSQGFGQLHLVTPDSDRFYKKLGWLSIGTGVCLGNTVVIMKKKLPISAIGS